MKNNLVKFIFSIFLLLPFHLNAELIFEDNFPKDMQGIWSDDCDAEYQVFIISNNTSMWIDETYVGLRKVYSIKNSMCDYSSSISKVLYYVVLFCTV